MKTRSATARRTHAHVARLVNHWSPPWQGPLAAYTAGHGVTHRLALGDTAGARQAMESFRYTAALVEVREISEVRDLWRALGEADPGSIYQRVVDQRLAELDLDADHAEAASDIADFCEYAGWAAAYWGLVQAVHPAVEGALGRGHSQAQRAAANWATEANKRGNFDAAIPVLRRLYEETLAAHGAEDRNTQWRRLALGTALRTKGAYAQAQEQLEAVHTWCRQHCEADDDILLTSMNDLGTLYYSQGDYAGAEPLYRRCLEARERILGAEHPDTLGSVNNLATLYNSQGRYAEAEPLYQGCLEAIERTLGAEHPFTLTSLNNLGLFYQSQGRYAEAEPLCQRCLEAIERTLGAEHPDTLMSLSNLATLYDSQGRYTEAEPLYQRCLEASERTLGAEHPDTLISVKNLAHLYANLGRTAEAGLLYERALAWHESTYGVGHYKTLIAKQNLAVFWRRCLDYSKANVLHEQVTVGFEHLQESYPDRYASAWFAWARTMITAGDVEAARSHAQKALAVAQLLQQEEYQDKVRALLLEIGEKD